MNHSESQVGLHQIGQLAQAYKYEHFHIHFLVVRQKSIAVLPLMSEIHSQIDATEIDFETKYLPFNEVKYNMDPQLPLKKEMSCTNEMRRLHQKFLSNTKRIVSKLCYSLSKFSPFEPVIKQSYEDIQRMQDEWCLFTGKSKDKYSFLHRSQALFPEDIKQQQISFKKMKESLQIKVPIIRKPNSIQSHFFNEKTFPIFGPLKSEVDQSNQSMQLRSVSFDGGSQTNVSLMNQSDYRSKLKDQFYHIKRFVFFQLHPKLMLQYDKILQKKVVLNCYIAWNREINREIQIPEMAKLQMELTVQIKEKFSNIDTKRKFFKGIGFKEQFIHQMNLTDRKPIVHEQDILFDDDSIMNPIDQIIKIARSNQKSEIQKPYTEEQLQALDVALGLS